MKKLSLLAFTLLLASCSSDVKLFADNYTVSEGEPLAAAQALKATATDPVTVNYQCGDKSELKVAYKGETANLLVKGFVGETFDLMATKSLNYTTKDGKVTLIVDGRNVTYSNNSHITICSQVGLSQYKGADEARAKAKAEAEALAAQPKETIIYTGSAEILTPRLKALLEESRKIEAAQPKRSSTPRKPVVSNNTYSSPQAPAPVAQTTPGKLEESRTLVRYAKENAKQLKESLASGKGFLVAKSKLDNLSKLDSQAKALELSVKNYKEGTDNVREVQKVYAQATSLYNGALKAYNDNGIDGLKQYLLGK